MSFFPKKIESSLDKITYIETCWNAGAGKIGQIRGIASDLAMGGLILKVFNVERYWLLVLAGVVYVSIVFIFGVFLEKKKIVYRQGDVTNKLTNPQLYRIEDKVDGIYGKVMNRLKHYD